jgi:superfamily II DNA or RNA helicase
MKPATILIKDEVNVKITGLDLDTRRKLTNKFKYEVPYARHLPAVKLGRWDGKVGFFQLGGSTYINLLDEIVPTLISEGYELAIDDRRTYQTSFSFQQIVEDSFAHITWPDKHTLAGQPILLRDHQLEVIDNFLNNPQSLQEVATGAGKTIVTAALSYTVEQYGRSIVIVPNKSLVTQTEEDYRNLQLDVGVYYGGRKEFGHQHTICTWQSLNNLFKKTKDGEADITIHEFLEDVVCVIVDEVHSAKADALKGMLTGPFAHIPIRWGLTGTIPKEDFEFKSLQVSIGNVVGQVTAAELQKKGILAECHVNILQLIDHVEFKQYQAELKYLLSDTNRLDHIAQTILDISESGNTLVLVDRVSAGKELVSRMGDLAVFVSGATKTTQRKEHYDEIATANNKIIVATYGVAAVGINIPRIFNLVLIEPGKSFVRVIQSIGRGVRIAKDKDFVQIWDITSTCKFAKRHLTKRKQFYREAEYPFKIEKVNWK